MNYMERDTYGIYKANLTGGVSGDGADGPGPALMGANTLIGNEVYSHQAEALGEVKEIMLDVLSGRIDAWIAGRKL